MEMHNLLRMDLYHLRTSKSWRRSILGLGMFALIYALFFVICLDEDINAWFLARGMIFSMNFKGEFTLSVLGIYQKFLSSGICIGMVLILYGTHLYAEFQDGFIKNIGAAYIDPKQYILSKIIKAGIMSFVYVLISFLMTLIVCMLFPNLFQMDTVYDIVSFLILNWFLITSLCVFVCMLVLCVRNKTLIIIYAVLLGSSMWTMLEHLVLSLFQVEEWIRYDIYYQILDCPITFAGDEALPIAIQALVMISLCAGIGYAAFVNKDIA